MQFRANAKYFQVFFDEDPKLLAPFVGTQASVYYISKEDFETEQMQLLAQQSNMPASCFVKDSANSEEFSVRIFNQSQEIQLCGHGLLAVAYLLTRIKGLSAKRLWLPNHQIEIKLKAEEIWLGFEPVEIQAASLESNLLSCFNQVPIASAKTTSNDGYWILEWPENYQLSQLEVDFEQLTRSTNRAVIATQVGSKNSDFDFNLRYFAPQHGVNEDLATGSANRILANYWQQKLKQTQFKACQLSKVGATIFSKVERKKIWLSGKVRELLN